MFIADIILTAGSIILLLALFPTLLAKEKPAPSTSLLTALVLSVFATVYFLLSLHFTAASSALTAFCWFILFFQARGILGRDKPLPSE